MKLFYRLILIVATSIILPSCFALHTGLISGTASISSNNFKLIKRDVRARTSTWIILGIGGIEEEAMVRHTKNRMVRENNLQSNQFLTNVTVDFKTTIILGLAINRECFMSADVIEFL